MKALGHLFKTARESAELTQEDVAGTNMSTRTLQRLEDGAGNTTAATLFGAAYGIGKKLIIYLGNSDEEKLLDVFGRATDRNKALIIGYAEGLLAVHQPEPGPRGKKRVD